MDELYGPEGFEIDGAAAAEIIEHDNRGSQGAERFGEVGSDEARAAGDEDAAAVKFGSVQSWPIDGGNLLHSKKLRTTFVQSLSQIDAGDCNGLLVKPRVGNREILA